MNWTDRIFSLCIPSVLTRDEVDLGKARNVVGMAMLAIGVAAPFGCLYAWLGNMAGAKGIATVPVLLLVSMLLLRGTANLKLVQAYMVCCIWGLFAYLAWTMGGRSGMAMVAWFSAVPLVATFLGGLLPGLVWLGISTATVGAFAWAGASGAMAFPLNPVRDMAMMDTVSNVGLVPFVGGLGLVFQYFKNQSDRVRAEQVQTIEALLQAVNRQTQEVSTQVSEMAEALEGQNVQAAAMRSASEVSSDLVSTLERTSDTLGHQAALAKASASQGAEVVGVAIANGVALAQAIARADELMGQLQARSRQISGAVDRIQGLAFQTNILALNATIEAAHAGAQGRGFAVVADNVRKLATEAGEAASSIGSELDAVVGDIRDTARLLNDSQGLAVSGRENADHARQALQAIQEAVMRVNAEVAQLQAVSERQSRENRAMQDVTGRMEQGIAQVVQGSGTIRELMRGLESRLCSMAT